LIEDEADEEVDAGDDVKEALTFMEFVLLSEE